MHSSGLITAATSGPEANVERSKPTRPRSQRQSTRSFVFGRLGEGGGRTDPIGPGRRRRSGRPGPGRSVAIETLTEQSQRLPPNPFQEVTCGVVRKVDATLAGPVRDGEGSAATPPRRSRRDRRLGGGSIGRPRGKRVCPSEESRPMPSGWAAGIPTSQRFPKSSWMIPILPGVLHARWPRDSV